MIPPAVFALAAQTDLRNAVEWIAKDNPAAARSLRMAAGRAARRIGDHPAIGAARPGLGAGHYRFLRLRGFPYLLVYTTAATPPRILRVLQMSRDLPPLLADVGP
jgi:toxin ParE1/3/4